MLHDCCGFALTCCAAHATAQHDTACSCNPCAEAAGQSVICLAFLVCRCAIATARPP